MPSLATWNGSCLPPDDGMRNWLRHSPPIMLSEQAWQRLVSNYSAEVLKCPSEFVYI